MLSDRLFLFLRLFFPDPGLLSVAERVCPRSSSASGASLDGRTKRTQVPEGDVVVSRDPEASVQEGQCLQRRLVRRSGAACLGSAAQMLPPLLLPTEQADPLRSTSDNTKVQSPNW